MMLELFMLCDKCWEWTKGKIKIKYHKLLETEFFMLTIGSFELANDNCYVWKNGFFDDD